MIWPFSRKPSANVPDALVFKSPEAFLEYQCEYGETDIQPKDQGIAALVMDSAREFGVSASVQILENGCQRATLKVASDDGGFIVIAQTPTNKGEKLRPGDTVIWLPFEYSEQFGNLEGVDSRFGWAGFIVAKIKPEIDLRKKSFDVLCRYD
ncbi:hypothetical protein [Roseibium aggregatum]|uniref:Uncharacterized protein n=1 Tax=Roseibium aggregatum TaxID=187304 RepID=A0A0M6YB15_9HYPH|nr:hypothetical protein [Roseibium aggregatum]CTQ47286.1 hypothetical protein LAL4801_05748 [Roseibium aggregatum]